jgi:predicted RNA methylase
VGHYVALRDDSIVIQRWDKKSSFERYSHNSVCDKLEKFHQYLISESPRQDISIVSHVIQVFRSLRATLGKTSDGTNSLRALLCLLACAKDNAKPRNLALADWRLSKQAADIASSINEGDWQALQNELCRGRMLEDLVPDFTLFLRHASGELFQEAHYEAVFVAQDQMRFGGFLPSPVGISKTRTKALGLHFTPAALARAVVEEALIAVGPLPEAITIFDPACGSGEFLRESLRQLNIMSYTGQIRIIGWDISEAACDMASFVLAWETRDIRGQVDVEIRCVDSLASGQVWPTGVDIVLMNPPFASWQEMGVSYKQALTAALGRLSRPRPDLSHAFLWLAASCIRDGGVLGTILPASFLDSTSAENLRKNLSERISPRLIARLGSHALFSNATIDAALFIAKKDTNVKEPSIAFWADYRSSSNSAGLRALRRTRLARSPRWYPVIGEGFSIYPREITGSDSGSWAPRPYSSWKLLQSLTALPKVNDLFNVRQGIRTGLIAAFLLSKQHWETLPEHEKGYFRPAVVNKSIKYGFLQDSVYIFYPYGDKEIETEEELRQTLEHYYQRYLLPNKDRLLSRAEVNRARWWELTRHRAWQIERSPKLVSTYFGDAGSFAWDENGEFVVVQGFAWLPKRIENLGALPTKVSLAYLAILNSSLFSDLLSAVSNNVGGGQWNLSEKFVNKIALPDLLHNQDITTISLLANIGKRMHQGLPTDGEQLDELVHLVYGLDTRL